MFAEWYSIQKPISESWLHDLHSHPETGFEETKTAAFVASRLTEFGYEVATGLGGTGVVGTLHGAGASDAAPGRRIGFRAELDALPMAEEADVPYRSKVEGRFHGCGHDGHTVTALTAAAYLAHSPDFEGTVHFIFQPAEELLTGARAMLADGLFKRFPCDEIYALHNLPGLPAGKVGIPSAAAMASADNIDVTIRANGAHGSMPHIGEDAIAAASAFIGLVQQTSTRIIDAREAGVISFGVLTGGTARNVLPAEVSIEGTMRTNAPEIRDRLATLLQEAATAAEHLYGVAVELQVTKVAPVTINNSDAVAAVTASARRVAGADKVIADARNLMASEDFSEFLNRVPGSYFFIGQDGRAPHHPEFVFDPSVIPLGAAIFADLAKSRTRGVPDPHPQA